MNNRLKIKAVSRIRQETMYRVYDILETKNGKISKSWFVKQIKKEILEQIDVEEIVVRAYAEYRRKKD